MAMTENMAYEVQVHHNGRWQLHSRHSHSERAVAVKEAKQISETNKRLPVRVIMEDYDPDTARHDEILIFRNRIETKKNNTTIKGGSVNWADMAVSTDGRVGFLPEDQNDDYAHSFDYDEPRRKKNKVSTGMFLGIVMLVLGVGIGVGAVSAGALFLLVKGFGAVLAPSTLKSIMLGMFLLVGFIAGMSTLNYYRLHFDLNPFAQKKRPQAKIKKSKMSKQMEKAALDIDRVPSAEVQKEQEEAKVNIFEREEEFPESITPNEGDDGKPAFSNVAQEQKIFLVNFLGAVMAALKGPQSSFNQINRFGLNLFLTGACLRISQDHALTDDEEFIILSSLLEMLGAKNDQAERFAMEYDKYLVDERHNNLFMKAGDIVLMFKDKHPDLDREICIALEEWVNYKKDEGKNPNQLCVFFTDMVGSTDLTTKHGDYAAQEVLKAHDLIVRTALTNFNGIEIKHLGDGIMASFQDTNQALEAAKEILKRVEGNNNAGPEFPLHIRIGMNVGEPIRKNNDLFGNVVQLSARLCSVAETDSVAVSKFLVEDCGEKTPYTFDYVGLKELKGFEVPQDVYHLDWTAPPRTFDEEAESEEEQNTEVSDQEETASENQPAEPAPIPDGSSENENIVPCAPLPAEGIAPDLITPKAAPVKKYEFQSELHFEKATKNENAVGEVKVDTKNV